jgi:hypothetical protein
VSPAISVLYVLGYDVILVGHLAVMSTPSDKQIGFLQGLYDGVVVESGLHEDAIMDNFGVMHPVTRITKPTSMVYYCSNRTFFSLFIVILGDHVNLWYI